MNCEGPGRIPEAGKNGNLTQVHGLMLSALRFSVDSPLKICRHEASCWKADSLARVRDGTLPNFARCVRHLTKPPQEAEQTYRLVPQCQDSACSDRNVRPAGSVTC